VAGALTKVLRKQRHLDRDRDDNAPKRRRASTNVPVPTRTHLAAAYHEIIATKDVAAALGISARTVRRSKVIVSGACLEHEVATATAEYERMRANIDFAFDVRAFDGSRFQISVPLDPSMTLDQQTSGWECMSTRCILVFGNEAEVCQIEFTTAPIPMLNTDAGTTYEALYCPPLLQPVLKLIERVLASAKFPCRVRGTDAAKAVKKFLAYESQPPCTPQSVSYTAFHCAIHQIHLQVGVLLIQIGLNIISVLYSAAKLLRQGAYFLRLVLGVRLVVNSTYTAIAMPASEEDLRLSKVFLTMCDGDGGCDDDVRKQRDDAADEFISVFNGGFRMWLRVWFMCHYCNGSWCCIGPWMTRLRMIKAILVYLLRRRPDVPMLARWTQVTPCVLFFMRLWVVHRLFGHLLATAFKDIRVKLVKAVDSLSRNAAMHEVNEQAIKDEFAWHATCGGRLTTVETFFADFATNGPSLYFMTLFLTPLAFITHWLLKARDITDVPLLTDLQNCDFSAIHMIMQYFSGMLTFEHDRMLILVLICGSETRAAFFNDKVPCPVCSQSSALHPHLPASPPIVPAHVRLSSITLSPSEHVLVFHICL
jgi:hypothetical protein